jgi:putative DNA primase/helicase
MSPKFNDAHSFAEVVHQDGRESEHQSECAVEVATRKLPLTRYANKTDNIGKQNAGTWDQIAGLLGKRDIRTDKDGKAFAPTQYEKGTTRAKANVLSISLAVADIDDGTTLDELKPVIASFSWVAYSSHSHTAAHPKFRIVFPLLRDCTPDEWPAVWEGLNRRLQGHCDPACKDVARLYFLPSCPSETQADAFYVCNEGEWLAPDMLKAGAAVVGGRVIATNEFSRKALSRKPLAETQDNIACVESMLAVLDPDPYPAGEGKNRETYLKAIWGVADLAWNCGYALARNWAESGDLFDSAAFDKDWNSFSADGGIHYGTLKRYAMQAGWTDTTAVAASTRAAWESLNDAGNGDRLLAAYGDSLAYVADSGRWLIRHQGRWHHDKKANIVVLATSAMRRVYREAETYAAISPDLADATSKHAGRSLRAGAIDAAIKLAATAPTIAITSDQLDADNYLLGVRNGVLDLRTGTLRDEQREDWITRSARVEYDQCAKAPTWLAFLDGIMAGDRDLIDFLQTLAGYCLTGDTREQKFFFFYGTGANGKSTFLNTLREMMGGYAVQARPEVLMVVRGGSQAHGHTADIMPLIGARLAAANETEEGQRLAESLIKQLTGGEPIMVRSPYGRESALVMPQFKAVMAGNHRPIIRGTDHGIWRRLVCVPFTVTIPDDQQDKMLMDRLRAEYAGILNWALEGCLRWQTQGLTLPPILQMERKAYMTEMDVLQRWIDECCDVGPGHTWAVRGAYSDFNLWAKDGGYGVVSETRFAQQISEKGFTRIKKNTGSVIVGVRSRQGTLI